MLSRLDSVDGLIKLLGTIVGGVIPKKVTLCSPVLAALGFANPKAAGPILVTLLPIVTLVNRLLRKVFVPILVTLSGIVTLVN